MAYRDDCGEIILDAVLTDAGRKRMAQGRFKITKFALGDEEIDYGYYDRNSQPPATNDPVMTTIPVMEANASNDYTLKTFLMSHDREDLLYMPELIINTNAPKGNSAPNMSGKYVVIYDKNTLSYLNGTWASGAKNFIGENYIDGIDPSRTRNIIAIDQGINYGDHIIIEDEDETSTTISPDQTHLMDGWVENMYILSIDDRIGRVVSAIGQEIPMDASVVETNIARYIIDNYTGKNTFMINTNTEVDMREPINGPRGSRIQFKISPSKRLINNEGYYDQFGSVLDAAESTNMFGATYASEVLALGTFKYIDRYLKVTSNKTGFFINVPLRFIKKTA
tara:strand:+ start:39 stop:1049 length:1011 start_codon:yes stop_codon:yes gene_type:complete